jgi:ribulose-5-phosphate 4-epimerase/fuculose-1-phosphate aldolase
MSATKTQTVEKIETKVSGTTHKGYSVDTRGSHNLARGGEHPYQLPKFDDMYKKRRWMLQHMAGAFRVFARKGYTEGTAGHISIRDPVDPNTFWINPLGKHFGLLKASDMVHVDEHGNILPDGNQAAINAAGFAIHSAIHVAYPHVNAACHTHSIYGKAYSALGRPLDMINQDVLTFYKTHSVYTDFGGVALEAAEGAHIAKSIGPNGKGAILQNHGLITVGATVDEAAYVFTLMERSCEANLLALQACNTSGVEMKIVGHEEAAYTEFQQGDPETLYTEFQPDLEMEHHLDPSYEI